jgi:hypothetical protein
MSGVYQIPPVRDLPSGRLAQRREHLLAEIVRDREPDRAPASMRSPWFRRPKVVALVAATFLLLATACAFGVRALVLDKGFIGLPPEGATPSTPEIGKLVLKYESIHPGTWFWVYADGRVIWNRQGDFAGGANRFSTGFLEQHLTAKGVELLRSAEGVELLRSGLLASLHRPDHPYPFPDVNPVSGARTVGIGDGLAELVEPGTRAYVPARYAVCYGAPDAPEVEPSRILSALPAKARELLSAGLLFSQVEPELGQSHPEACSELTTDEARTVAEAFRDAGMQPFDPRFEVGDESATLGDYSLGYLVPIPGTAESGLLGFEPMLPHGEWICPGCG